MSNFLGSVEPMRSSSLVSTAELTAREGVNLQKAMNYRADGRRSVFLVLPHNGIFCDEWDEENAVYIFIGHDSIAMGGKAEHDQKAMYESGRLSDNGKFLKALDREERIEIQVYEKVDTGVWYDKGFFILIGATESKVDGRRVYTFFLEPSNKGHFSEDRHHRERMLSATEKTSAWAHDNGRCHECHNEQGLRFVERNGTIALLCPIHRGEGGGLLG